MRAVQSSAVKATLPEFLDAVERGESIVITHHGKPVAHLVPAPDVDRERVRAAIEGIREMRKNCEESLDSRGPCVAARRP